MNIEVFAYNIAVLHTNKNQKMGTHRQMFDTVNNAIMHAKAIRDEWCFVKLYQGQCLDEVLTFRGNDIYCRNFRFIKGRTYRLQDGSSFAWDGNETPDNIMCYRDSLCTYVKELFGD